MTYTWTEAPDVNPMLKAPGGHLDGLVLRRYALVLGDPMVGALVLEGTKTQLSLFVDMLHILLRRDPLEDLALTVAQQVATSAKCPSDPEGDSSVDVVDQVARDVSLAVVAALKTAGYLTPPTPGVT